ncbi:MAG TPA: M48 family metallopeptidase [Planctomycetota bacterium]|nr:M48 family metallopeptidase [Planctomycetota bacterium]
MRHLIFWPLLAAVGCVTNPYTGRDQFILLSEAEESQLGIQGYQEVLGKERVSQDPREIEPVRRVGERIAAAANRPDFKWEFNVIVDDETLNAWCMPGGKIAFYTGIFPVLQDEAGMAFVMGHEVSHALLRHGAERVSQNLASGALGTLLSAAIGGRDEKTQQIVLAAFGAAAGVGVLLPFSRAHESESDALGLTLMAQAGYDPRKAVEVWKRMQQTAGGGGVEFLSTHPSHETRIRDLEARLPEALAIYEKAQKAPVAALPKVGGRKGLAKAGGGAALAPAAPGDAGVQAVGSRRGTLEDGRPALQLDFTFASDVYLREIRVQGPGGLATKVEAKAGVPGRVPKQLLLFREKKEQGALPEGRYTLTFVSATSGRAFELPAAYDVR